jgi:hypothetical protein
MYTDHYITEEEHDHWFQSAIHDPTRRYWIIVSDGQDVGLVNLYAIDQRHMRCHWAYYIGDQGKESELLLSTWC